MMTQAAQIHYAKRGRAKVTSGKGTEDLCEDEDGEAEGCGDHEQIGVWQVEGDHGAAARHEDEEVHGHELGQTGADELVVHILPDDELAAPDLVHGGHIAESGHCFVGLFVLSVKCLEIKGKDRDSEDPYAYIEWSNQRSQSQLRPGHSMCPTQSNS
jgi:hypothetical protein